MSYKNFIITLLSSTFLLYTLTILDFLSIGSNLYLQSSHNIKLENFNMMVFTVTTIISQIIYGGLSNLQAGVCGGAIFESASMVRNIHETCELYTTNTTESLSNAFFAVMISTLIFGLFSYFLGCLKMGSFFSYIPRSALFGVMTSIGYNLMKDGFSQVYEEKALFTSYISMAVIIFLVILAYFLEKKFEGYVFFIPLYTCTVLILFYSIFLPFGFNLSWLRSNFLVPEISTGNISVSEFTKYLSLSVINKKLLFKLIPKILGLSLVNMIHITVNIPSFSSCMKINSNINREFKVQGIANIFTGLFGYPTYFINCTSIYFNKSGGTTKMHSLLSGLFLIGLIFIGPMSRQILPRILLAFIPVYMGGAFVISNLLEHIFVASYIDISIILLSTIIGIYNPILGLICGSLYQLLIFYISLKISNNEYEELNEYYKKIQKNYKMVKIDFPACFINKEKLKKNLKIESNKILIDMRNCQYIDYEGNEMILEIIRNMEGEVLMIGDPINLYKEKFRSVLI
ncbi:putative sulfate transporter [Vairimorpha necatrix]|uniref:Sulfate transporter n=1 Tax=Vairimorpha necatrix TaxID=6039 RepID=A0AAX4J9Q2_9MICR